MPTRQLELSVGTIDCVDTGGAGPTLVLLHGLLMDASLWDGAVADLGRDHRCVVPTLPLGAHRHAVRDHADLSLPGVARLVAELLEHLDLHDVTLVGNDTGGALVQLLAVGDHDRVGRIALVSCDAFDNFPPGLSGRTLLRTGKLPPPLFGAFMLQLRLRPARRLPLSFGWLTRRGDAATKGWLRPVLTQRAIRGDAVRMLRAVAGDGPVLADASDRLAGFDRPALVVWATEDRVMPPAHGRRLAALLPRGRLVQVADSYTLVPLDQPVALAAALREFVRTT